MRMPAADLTGGTQPSSVFVGGMWMSTIAMSGMSRRRARANPRRCRTGRRSKPSSSSSRAIPSRSRTESSASATQRPSREPSVPERGNSASSPGATTRTSCVGWGTPFSRCSPRSIVSSSVTSSPSRPREDLAAAGRRTDARCVVPPCPRSRRRPPVPARGAGRSAPAPTLLRPRLAEERELGGDRVRSRPTAAPEADRHSPSATTAAGRRLPRRLSFAVFDDGSHGRCGPRSPPDWRCSKSPGLDEVSAVRVRMGLHRGRAQVVGDGDVGMAVHHAARVSATARGGEILASARNGGRLRTRDGRSRRAPAQGRAAPNTAGADRRPRSRSGVSGARGRDLPARRTWCASRSRTTRSCCARASPACSRMRASRSSARPGNADDLLELVATRPDVAIVDIRMPPTHTDEGSAPRRRSASGTRTPACCCSRSTSSRATRSSLFASRGATRRLPAQGPRRRRRGVHPRIRRVADGGVSVDVEILEQLRD